MNDSSAVDLHVLNGGRVRNGNSSLEGVVRVSPRCLCSSDRQASHKSALPFSWDIDERLHFEEDLVGGGAPAALKAMKVGVTWATALTAVAFTAQPEQRRAQVDAC